MAANARMVKHMQSPDDEAVARSLSASSFRAAMGSFAAGVTIVTTIDSLGRPHALTATAFSSVSLSPPLCLVCIDRGARTYRSLMRSGCYAVNILNADQRSLSTHFASSIVDKFEAVRWRAGKITGCPMLEGALACVECRIVEIYSGGDHDIFLGHVASEKVHDGAPLVYWRGSYSSLPPPPEKESAARDNTEILD